MDDLLNMEQGTLGKQEQKEKTEEETQALRAHLTELQHWEIPAGETLANQRAAHGRFLNERQQEKNERLSRTATERFPVLQTGATASGQPQQPQAPAKESYKQRREKKRLDEEAKKATPMADHVSYHMVESLKDVHSMCRNSAAILPQELREQMGDGNRNNRILYYVCGHRVNKDGEPASPQDAVKRDADYQFLSDYLSGDLERRRPHLERMLEQALAVRVTPDMLTPEYLEYHAGEVNKEINMLTTFQDVYDDPINKDYFDHLPAYKKDLIESRIFSRYAQLGNAMADACFTKAVNANNCEFQRAIRRPSQMAAFNRNYEFSMQALQDVMTEMKQTQQAAVETELTQRLSEAETLFMNESDLVKSQADLQSKYSGLGLTSYVTELSLEEVSKYRSMIEEHPQEYAEHKDLVDALYQGLYRCVDAMGDVKLRLKTTQYVIDGVNVNPFQQKMSDKLLKESAHKMQKQAEAQEELLMEQNATYGNALEALLRGKTLSMPAAELLNRLAQETQQ